MTMCKQFHQFFSAFILLPNAKNFEMVLGVLEAFIINLKTSKINKNKTNKNLITSNEMPFCSDVKEQKLSTCARRSVKLTGQKNRYINLSHKFYLNLLNVENHSYLQTPLPQYLYPSSQKHHRSTVMNILCFQTNNCSVVAAIINGPANSS